MKITDERLREIVASDPVAVTYDVVRDVARELLELRQRVAVLERVRKAAAAGIWDAEIDCDFNLLIFTEERREELDAALKAAADG